MFCMPTTGLGATEFFECGLPGGPPCLRLLKMCMFHVGAVHPPRAISCFCVCPLHLFRELQPSGCIREKTLLSEPEPSAFNLVFNHV